MIFGLTQSPYILEGTLKRHFENYRHDFEESINRNEKDMYVDDLVTGKNTVDEVRNVKKDSVELFQMVLFFISGTPMSQLWRAIT